MRNTTGNSRRDTGNRNPGQHVAYSLFLECVHCGLCTSACPTFTELGDENDGPRGRIHLMRAVADGRIDVSGALRRHLELCLDCRACETACPSGVHYGRLIEPFRLAMAPSDGSRAARFDWFRELILLRLFPYAGRLRLALAPARVAQRLGLLGLAERLGCSAPTYCSSVAKLSVCGTGMRSHTGVARRMFQSLAAAGINVEMISTSEVHVNVVVDGKDGPSAQELLKEEFADAMV